MKLPWRKVYPGPPIETSLTENEARFLRALSLNARVIEVGSAYGYSTITMAFAAKIVYAIDHHEHMDTVHQLMSNLSVYGVYDRVKVMVGNSKELIPTVPEEKVDLVFIDGDHSYEGVLSDVRLSLPFLKSGSHLAFHDYGEDSCPEVKKAVDYLLKNDLKDKVTFAVHADTLFVVRVL